MNSLEKKSEFHKIENLKLFQIHLKVIYMNKKLTFKMFVQVRISVKTVSKIVEKSE